MSAIMKKTLFVSGLVALSFVIVPAPSAHANDALKGAVIGAGVGALVGGKQGAAVGAVGGAIIGGN